MHKTYWLFPRKFKWMLEFVKRLTLSFYHTTVTYFTYNISGMNELITFLNGNQYYIDFNKEVSSTWKCELLLLVFYQIFYMHDSLIHITQIHNFLLYIYFFHFLYMWCIYRLIRATEQLSVELHKSEVLLIVSTVLMVKTENIYRNTKNAYNDGNRSLLLNRF